MKWVSLLMLVFQTVSVVFAMRLSRTRVTSGPKYLNTTAVFFSELLKLICSFIFLSQERGSVGSAISNVVQNLTKNLSETAKVTVPSLLYTVQNNLLFVSLSNLSGAVYQVTYQLKILTTAVLSVIILGKALGPTKWSALLTLTLGVTCIQYPRGNASGSTPPPNNGNPVIGLTAVLSACVTSGLAGVYLEKILKQSDASIWLRNIQLGLFGALLAFIGCFMQDGALIIQGGFLQGYSPLVWGVIFLQAVGGLVVAAVLKYADNILKCFGNALSIVISCVMSGVFLQEFTPDLLFVVGTIFVLVATSMYSLGIPQEVQRMFRPKRCEEVSPADCA
jgi:UDP-sugar transporter A1/2/3